MVKKLKISSVVAVACMAVFVLACDFCPATAYAAEGLAMELSQTEDDSASLQQATSVKGATTDVELGAGVVGRKSFTVNQQDAKNTALDRLKYWRQNAYDDSNVKFDGKTIKELISAGKVNKNEYLNPSWSNALERIAMQRAIEAGDSSLGHTRPNGNSWNTATYNGIFSSSEVLAWGSGYTYNGTTAVDQWASEKAEYIKECKGQSHTETGHYKMLVDPSYKAYGFALCAGYNYENVAAGEAGTSLQGSASATNWKGSYNFDISISNTLATSVKGKENQQGVNINLYAGIARMNIGNEFIFSATLGYRNNTFTVQDNWYSTDQSVLQVQTSGRAKVLKAGSAYVYVLGQGNTAIGIEITIPEYIELYRLYNKYSGEHLYSSDANERDWLVNNTWNTEDIAWKSPVSSKTKVYRIYNPNTGEHHFTKDSNERNYLLNHNWNDEGVGWYSDDAKGVTVYRLFSPYHESRGSHHYTTDANEYKWLGNNSWNKEGICWYGLK